MPMTEAFDSQLPAPLASGSTASGSARLKTELVVIGAGQAGLSSAYHLSRLGLAPVRGFVLLDQAPEPGGAWQFGWPSLTLSTVNRIHDLPGMPFSEERGRLTALRYPERQIVAVPALRAYASSARPFLTREQPQPEGGT